MTAEQLISFARGAPSLDIVDVEGLKASAIRAFETDPAGVTAYGTSVGYLPLREWVADKHGVQPSHVLLTNGSLQADAFLFDQLVSAGDVVVVEGPTYDRTLLNLRNRGADVRQIPVQDDGLDIDALRALLESGVRPKLIHVIPNFQNPSGVTLSLAKRNALIGLAVEYGFTIFEDDPYADIRFRGEPLPSILSLALEAAAKDAPRAAEVVVHASSFTKTVCPGVRVGYLIGPSEVIAGIAATATNLYISPNMLAEATVYQFCVTGAIDESIKTVCTALSERARLLADAIRRHIPEATFIEPDGGYFLWVELPKSVDVDQLLPAAVERGVAVVKGSDFLLEGGRSSLRLAYSAVTSDQVDEGVRRLASAVKEVSSFGD